MALGKFYDRDSIAPPHGLKNFYETSSNIKIKEQLKEYINDKSFDSTYNTYFDPRCSYFIYETSDKRIVIITFGKGDLPNELLGLRRYLDSIINQEYLWITTKPFAVDSLFIEYESELFTKFPPPPRPKIKEY